MIARQHGFEPAQIFRVELAACGYACVGQPTVLYEEK